MKSFMVVNQTTQLCAFGSACYTHRVTRNRDKFGERSRLCVFVEYPFWKKGYKVYDMERDEFVISRDVVFREDVFPYATTSAPATTIIPVENIDEDWNLKISPVLVDTLDRGSSSFVPPFADPPAPAVDSPVPPVLPISTGDDTLPTETTIDDSNEILEEFITKAADLTDGTSGSGYQIVNEDLGRGRHLHVPSVKLKDYGT